MSDDLTKVFGDDGFDTDSVPAQVNFLPPGKYPCVISEAELKENKNGTGLYVKIVLTILEGPSKNRKFFCNINIKHSESQECVDIGLRTLASLGKALGLSNVTNLNQVRNQVVIAHATVRQEQNVVNVFSSPAAYTATPTGPAAPPTGPPVESPPESTRQQQPSAPSEPWRNPPPQNPPPGAGADGVGY